MMVGFSKKEEVKEVQKTGKQVTSEEEEGAK